MGSAFLRKMKTLQKEELWRCLHFWFNLSAIAFTVFGFIFAIAGATEDGSLPHFQQGAHQKVGLAIFFLIVVQVFAGLLLPQISS